MTTDFHMACKQIYMATRENTIAVFSLKGDVYFCIMNSKKFNLMVKDFPRSLVGVYDKRCNLKLIQEDIL